MHVCIHMPNFYEAFNYSFPQVISELVENSITSYNAHKDELPDGLDVHIDIDRKRREVRITDNAFGMSKEELATILGPFGSRERVSPKATIGTYGLGLLSASSWMSSRWKVESRRRGENIVRSLEVDASKFLEQAAGEIIEKPEFKKNDASWTRVLIQDINRRRWGKIKPYLGMRFRTFINEGSVRIS